MAQTLEFSKGTKGFEKFEKEKVKIRNAEAEGSNPFGSTITKEAGCLPCFFRGVKSAEGVRSRRAAPEAEQSGGLWSRRWSETCERPVEGGRGAEADRSTPSGPPSRRKQGVCPAFLVA